MAGQWFLPGGFIEPGELLKKALDANSWKDGVRLDDDREIVGCYPTHVHGYDMVQISAHFGSRRRTCERCSATGDHRHGRRQR